jgi:hypothetical protein
MKRQHFYAPWVWRKNLGQYFFFNLKKIKSIENVLNPLGLTVLQDPRALSLTAMLN